MGIYVASVNAQFQVSSSRLVAARDDFRIPSISSQDGVVALSWDGILEAPEPGTRGGTEVSFLKIGKSSPPIVIQGHEYKNFGNPRVSVLPGGKIVLTGTKGPRYIAQFSKDGTPLGRDYLTTQNIMFNSRGGAFAGTDDARICAAFDARVKNSPSDVYIRCSGNGGESWDDVRVLSLDDEANSVYPDIDMDKAGKVLVAWMNEGGDSATIVARYLGSDHEPRYILSDRAATYPSVAAGTWGDWVVWIEKSKDGKSSVVGANLRQ